MTDSEITLPETIKADSELHSCYGGWHNYLLSYTKLEEECDGVKFFSICGSNYFVFPSGFLVHNYGYHGRALMNQIRERGASVVEAETLEERRLRKELIRSAFQQERQEARQLSDWLLSCSHVEHAVPIEMSFGCQPGLAKPSRRWYGALYREAFEVGPKERLVTEGPFKPGDLRYEYRLYLLGRMYEHSSRGDKWVAVYDLPEEHKRPQEAGYGESNEWYTAFYWEDREGVTPAQRVYAPFGRMFALTLHRPMNFGYYKDQKIDTGERKPYVRLAMTVKYISAGEETC